VGSGPTEIGNRWNCPGAMVPPVNVIFVTASVTSPSSLVIGSASFDFSGVIVQPGTGSTDTNARGWSDGKVSSTWVVLASDFSLGTCESSLGRLARLDGHVGGGGPRGQDQPDHRRPDRSQHSSHVSALLLSRRR
jgi:hypothetical protein